MKVKIKVFISAIVNIIVYIIYLLVLFLRGNVFFGEPISKHYTSVTEYGLRIPLSIIIIRAG